MTSASLMKVLVVGSPGSGKSTFARKVHRKTGLPLHYLDMLWHLPDHTTVPEDIFDSRLMKILIEARWIIDGNYSRTLPVRLVYADTVFWLDYPPEICLEGIRNRIGTPREDMPWETETQPDPEFEQYVRDFPAARRPLLARLLEDAADTGKQVITFRDRAEADRYLASLPQTVENSGCTDVDK